MVGGASGQPLPKSRAILYEVWEAFWEGWGELLCGFNSLAQLLKIAQADVSPA